LAFLLTVAEAGEIGVVTVSGLPQYVDRKFAVVALCRISAMTTASSRLQRPEPTMSIPPYALLAIAIVAEVIATSALRASEGFSRLLPAAIVVVGYGIAFYCLSLTLRSIPIGIVYAVWSGVGIVLISLVAIVMYRQVPDVPAVIGLGLIISGVLVLNLYSKMQAH
jgi:small multidrug resistance pump